MHVRAAQPSDLGPVSLLAAELVRQHHRFDPQRFMLIEPVAQGYQRFFSGEVHRPGAVILVAEAQPGDPEVEGGILGYAYGTLEDRNWNDLLDACGKLNDLFVHPAARRMRVGQALLTAMLEALRSLGAPRVVLMSAWQNAEAHRFFESAGFRRTTLEMTRES